MVPLRIPNASSKALQTYDAGYWLLDWYEEGNKHLTQSDSGGAGAASSLGYKTSVRRSCLARSSRAVRTPTRHNSLIGTRRSS